MTRLPATPEHDKLFAVKLKSEIIGEFLQWLAADSVVLARWYGDVLDPDYEPIWRRLARYFETDLDKIEQEKRAILNEIRTGNSA